jgi:hypothetical protein
MQQQAQVISMVVKEQYSARQAMKKNKEQRLSKQETSEAQ